ncbi:hypothetical protein DXG01_005436 [Tephrocybe rancida]|nr:hypothetical protein DXG01_005436 [Tephrocybe rancida]
MSVSDKVDELLAMVTAITPLTPSATPNTVKSYRETNRINKKKMQQMISHINESGRDADTAQDDSSADGRFDAIIQSLDVTREDLNFPVYFVRHLLDKETNKGKLAVREDRGFRHLFVGYDGEPEDWATVLAPLRPSNNTWEKICSDSLANDATKDEQEQLLFTDKTLSSMAVTDRASIYVAYVLRTVQLLKFTMAWKRVEGQARGKVWRSDYIEAAFKVSHADLHGRLQGLGNRSAEYKKLLKEYNSQLKAYRKGHSRVMVGRKDLYHLYQIYGPIVLLNPTWDTIDVEREKQKGRTAEFHDIITRLCEECPLYEGDLDEFEGEPVSVPARSFESCFAALFHIMLNLASLPVAKYVCGFVVAHPPSKENTAGTNWKVVLGEMVAAAKLAGSG